MKRQKNFKIEEETLSELREFADSHSMSQTEVVEEAIRAYIRELYAGYTPDEDKKDSQTAPEVEALIRQLDVKDKQIEALSSALVTAQETAKGAQILHASDKSERALESVEQKKSRWARLRDAWRG